MSNNLDDDEISILKKRKEGSSYSLFARPIIDYDSLACDVTLDEADSTLRMLSTTQQKSNLTVAIMCGIYFIFATVLMSTFIFCRNRGDRFLKNSCVRVTWISMATFLTCYQFVLVITAIIEFEPDGSRLFYLEEWRKSDGCIKSDPFLRVSDDEVTYNRDLLDKLKLSSTVSLIICCLCFATQIFWLFMVLSFIYKHKNRYR